jgi:hypothetical protein
MRVNEDDLDTDVTLSVMVGNGWFNTSLLALPQLVVCPLIILKG